MPTEELEYVGFWARVGAALIDSLLVMFIVVPLLTAVYGRDYWTAESFVQGPADLLINWVLPAVAVVLFWVYRQATPGKMAIGARIVAARTGAKPKARGDCRGAAKAPWSRGGQVRPGHLTGPPAAPRKPRPGSRVLCCRVAGNRRRTARVQQRGQTMKRLILLAAIGSLLAAPLALAGPPHGPPPGHRGPPGYGAPYHGYSGGYRYPPYYQRHGHKHGNDSDDAAWAIGGLVLGAIIGTVAAKADQEEARQTVYESSSTPLPPPQKRKVVTCYDEVAYDEKGDPYVARQCYENWR